MRTWYRGNSNQEIPGKMGQLCAMHSILTSIPHYGLRKGDHVLNREILPTWKTYIVK